MCLYVIGFMISILNLLTFQGYAKESIDNHLNSDILRQKYGPVIFVNLLFRHGDRIIQGKSYPNDRYRNISDWNIGYGQLTKVGQQRAYKLGEWIKKNPDYRDLVGEYTVNDIYVRSSDIDRCLMTAECVLAAMYPVLNHTSPPIRPIPVHTLPTNQDTVIYMNTSSCPKYKAEVEKLASSSYMRTITDELQPLYKNLTEFTGTPINNLSGINLLYDILKIEHEQLHLELPKWAAGIYPDVLKRYSVLAFLSQTHTNEMKKLKAGPLLEDMLSHLVSKAEGTLNPDRKLWIYSGHDETIVTLLHALDVLKPSITIPSYSSLFAMELRKLDKEYFVTMMYKEGSNDTAIELRMKGCGDSACTLAQFRQLTRNLTVEDWNKACALARPPSNIYSYDSTSTGFVGGFVGWLLGAVILLCCPLTVCLFYKPRGTIKYSKLENEPQPQ